LAPARGSAQGTTDPTARNFDWTPTPHCPASRSHPTTEYVATRGAHSAIGQGAEVEVEQVAASRGDEHARDLRSAERGFHLLRRRRVSGDRPAGGVRRPDRLVIRLLRPENVGRQLELAVDRDLGHAEPGGAEPALPHCVLTL